MIGLVLGSRLLAQELRRRSIFLDGQHRVQMTDPQPSSQSLFALLSELSPDDQRTLFIKVRNPAAHSARSELSSLQDAERDQMEVRTAATLENSLSRAMDDLEAARALYRQPGRHATS